MDPTAIDSAPVSDLLVLQQVARIVSRADDSESRIQDILRHLARSVGLVRGRVLLADPGTGEIYIRYAHGLTPAELACGRYRIGEGVSGQVFQTGEATLVANVHDEPGYLARAIDRAALPPEQVAFLAVPIVHAHLPVGVLATHRLRNHERPAASDLALLEIIATMIGPMLYADDQRGPRSAATSHDQRPVHASEDHGDLECTSRDLLLRTAEQWYAEGRLHLATDRYLRVAQAYRDSEQSLLAKYRLLEIVRYYEAKGTLRLALDVLERMQRVLDEGADAHRRERTGHGFEAREDGGCASDRWDSDSRSQRFDAGDRRPFRTSDR